MMQSTDKGNATNSGGHAESLRFPTRVSGLDDVLRGGLPARSMSLVLGGAGTGKTMLALEIAYHAAASGESALFVSFEETENNIRDHAASLGWDLVELAENGRLIISCPRLNYEAVVAGEFSIDGLLAVMAGQLRQMDGHLIVVDAIDGLLRLFHNPSRRRDELHELQLWCQERELTTILTAKFEHEESFLQEYGHLEYMVACVIRLDHRVVRQVSTRRLRVTKLRGSGHSTNEHPYVISDEGTVIMPVTSMDLEARRAGKPGSSGNSGLDDILGGGYPSGASVLISGPTGSGKTSIACTCAESACRRVARVLYVSLEDGQDSLLSTMTGLGLDLEQPLDSGSLRVLTIMPESAGAEEHLLRVYRAMDQLEPHYVMLDALSAVSRMGTQEALFEFLIRLHNRCKQRGMTLLVTALTPMTQNTDPIAGEGVSSIFDTIVMLGYERLLQEVLTTVLVLKSRGVAHSHKLHRLTITSAGIRIGELPTETDSRQATRPRS